MFLVPQGPLGGLSASPKPHPSKPHPCNMPQVNPEGPAIEKIQSRSKISIPAPKCSIPIEIFNLHRRFQSPSFHLRGPRSVQRRARSKISIHDRSLEIFNPEGRDRIFSIPGPSGKTEVALQLSESGAAEVALQHSLLCSPDVIVTKSCAAASEKLQCNIEKAALQESGAFLPLSCGLQAPTFRHPRLGPAETSMWGRSRVYYAVYY